MELSVRPTGAFLTCRSSGQMPLPPSDSHHLLSPTCSAIQSRAARGLPSVALLVIATGLSLVGRKGCGPERPSHPSPSRHTTAAPTLPLPSLGPSAHKAFQPFLRALAVRRALSLSSTVTPPEKVFR